MQAIRPKPGWREKVPLGVFCGWMNLKESVRRRYPYKFSPHERESIVIVFEVDAGTRVETGKRIHICRRWNTRRFKNGITAAVRNVANSYRLDVIPGSSGVLVDCGANVGELGIWARDRGLRYMAFEPEPLEAECCDLNNFEGERRTVRKALWHEKGRVRFYSKPEYGDSSVLDMGDSKTSFSVSADRLDEMVTPGELGAGVRVLKIEAEGAEPEVLSGAEGVLSCFDYVAVDCGPERGVEGEVTFVAVNDRMVSSGFRLVAFNHHRVAALYHGTRRPGAGQ